MKLRKRFFLLELGTITLLVAIMFVIGTSRPWLSFLLMVGVITAHVGAQR